MFDLAALKRISALVYPVDTTIWLTSGDWGKVAAEVAALPDLRTDRARLTPTRRNFSRLKIGRLTAVNSGTEDQDVCNALNAPEEAKSNFRSKHDRWAVPASGKKEIEAVDAASTHEMPEALRQEAIGRLITLPATGVSVEVTVAHKHIFTFAEAVAGAMIAARIQAINTALTGLGVTLT